MAQYASNLGPAAGGSSGNASVGATGTAAPTSATEVGFVNSGGNLTAVSPSTPLPVTIDGGLANPLNVNIADFGGTAVTIGQQVMAASIPVVIASNQSAIPVSQSGSWTVTANAGTGTFAISAASLPLPTGASTSALQSNVQSAPGTPQTVAITVQGNASSVPIPISGTTSISGTVAVTQSTSPWIVA